MYDEYSQVCLENSLKTPLEWNFKSNSKYQVVLEHLNFNDGLHYINIIKNEFSNFYNNYKSFLIELCYINDSYGKPITYNYIDFCQCSPTCIRYIYHSLLNLTYIKNEVVKQNENEIDIIEIGGGYGGLCFFMNSLASLFNIKIKSYSIFDLYGVKKLQEVYLNSLNIETFRCFSLNENENDYNIYLKQNSYLISIYAFSEFSKDIQDIYINNIIKLYVSNGFILWNFIKPYNILDKKGKIEIERPNYRIINNENELNYFNYL